MKKKFVNFRPIVMVFVGIIVGILCGYCAMKGHLWVFCCIALLTFLVGLLFLVLKRFNVAIFVAVAFAMILVGFFNFNITYKNFCCDDFYGKVCKVSGKLTDYYSESNDSLFIIIKDPSVILEDGIRVYDNKNVGAWIYFEHEEERISIGEELFQTAQQYNQAKCMDEMEKMLLETIEKHKAKKS